MIEISADKVKLAETVMRDSPDKITKMLSRVINRVADGVKTGAARKVSEIYNIKTGSVRETLKISKGSSTNLGTTIRCQSGVIPLSDFKVRPGKVIRPQKTPIYAQVKKGGGGIIKRVFTAQMKEVGFGKNRRAAEPGQGHIGVFVRAGQARNPIKEIYGPSVSQMLGNPEAVEYIEKLARLRLGERFDHEMNRYLRGINR